MPLYKPMKKNAWKSRIKKACKAAGTYQPFFDHVIASLAGILELRDRAEEQYIESGSSPIVKHTIRNGAVNIVKNPTLVVIMECNAQALAYWRELGLTSKAYKAMTGGLTVPEEESSLEQVLAELGI